MVSVGNGSSFFAGRSDNKGGKERIISYNNVSIFKEGVWDLLAPPPFGGL